MFDILKYEFLIKKTNKIEFQSTSVKENLVQLIEQDSAEDLVEKCPFFKKYFYLHDLVMIEKYLANIESLDKSCSKFYQCKEFFLVDKFLQFFISDISIMNDTLWQSEKIDETINKYFYVSKNCQTILPLLCIRETCHLILNSKEFDKKFYQQQVPIPDQCQSNEKEKQFIYHLMNINLSIKFMTYKQKEAKGFNIIEWNTFQDMFSLYTLEGIQNIQFKQEFPIIASELLKQINSLILYQLKYQHEENIYKIDSHQIIKLKKWIAEEHINPSFEIINYYLNIIDQTEENIEIQNLAVLRVITVIGEILKRIEILIPEDKKTSGFKDIIALRDYIVHASTYDFFKYLQKCIKGKDQTNILFQVVLEIKTLRKNLQFYGLQNWFSSISFNKIHNFKIECEKLIKDDRNEKLSTPEYEHLLLSLSTMPDKIQNKEYDKVIKFMNGGLINKEEFQRICANMKNKQAKNIYEKIKEINKINSIQNQIKNNTIDFSSIKLNIKGEDKQQLQEIIQNKNNNQLDLFLNDYKQKKQFTKEENKLLKEAQEFDLKQRVEQLKNFINGKQQLQRSEFNIIINVVFFDSQNNNKKTWNDYFNKVIQQNEQWSKKNYMILQISYLIKKFEELKTITNDKLLKKSSISLDLESNPLVSIACEMLYGFCLNIFKNIIKHIDSLYDYNDESLYYFKFEQHPLIDIKKELEILIEHRNQMFHFEKLFEGGGYTSVLLQREIFFSEIQNTVQGIFQVKELSILEKLKKFESQLNFDKDQDTLNVSANYKQKENSQAKQNEKIIIQNSSDNADIKYFERKRISNKNNNCGINVLACENNLEYEQGKQDDVSFCGFADNKVLTRDYLQKKLLEEIVDNNSSCIDAISYEILSFWNVFTTDFLLKENALIDHFSSDEKILFLILKKNLFQLYNNATNNDDEQKKIQAFQTYQNELQKIQTKYQNFQFNNQQKLEDINNNIIKYSKNLIYQKDFLKNKFIKCHMLSCANGGIMEAIATLLDKKIMVMKLENDKKCKFLHTLNNKGNKLIYILYDQENSHFDRLIPQHNKIENSLEEQIRLRFQYIQKETSNNVDIQNWCQAEKELKEECDINSINQRLNNLEQKEQLCLQSKLQDQINKLHNQIEIFKNNFQRNEQNEMIYCIKYIIKLQNKLKYTTNETIDLFKVLLNKIETNLSKKNKEFFLDVVTEIQKYLQSQKIAELNNIIQDIKDKNEF